MQWTFTLLTATLLASCCRPPDLDGTWIATSTVPEWRGLLKIQGDTMSLLNPTQLDMSSHPMHLTCDSLDGPYDRLAFTFVDDTVLLDRNIIMYEPERIQQADIHTGTHQIYLQEVSTRYSDGPSSYFTPFYLGPCQPHRTCPGTFLNGLGLGIQDQYADSTDLEEWFVFARTEWPDEGPRSVVIYPDTSVSQHMVNALAERIHSELKGNVTVYQGFFLATAKYYLTFDILRRPATSAVNQ
jgi:hypothetical protein